MQLDRANVPPMAKDYIKRLEVLTRLEVLVTPRLRVRARNADAVCAALPHLRALATRWSSRAPEELAHMTGLTELQIRFSHLQVGGVVSMPVLPNL